MKETESAVFRAEGKDRGKRKKFWASCGSWMRWRTGASTVRRAEVRIVNHPPQQIHFDWTVSNLNLFRFSIPRKWNTSRLTAITSLLWSAWPRTRLFNPWEARPQVCDRFNLFIRIVTFPDGTRIVEKLKKCGKNNAASFNLGEGYKVIIETSFLAPLSKELEKDMFLMSCTPKEHAAKARSILPDINDPKFALT